MSYRNVCYRSRSYRCVYAAPSLPGTFAPTPVPLGTSAFSPNLLGTPADFYEQDKYHEYPETIESPPCSRTVPWTHRLPIPPRPIFPSWTVTWTFSTNLTICSGSRPTRHACHMCLWTRQTWTRSFWHRVCFKLFFSVESPDYADYEYGMSDEFTRTSENVRTIRSEDFVLLISIPNQKIVSSIKYIEISASIFFSPDISVLILKSLERNLFPKNNIIIISKKMQYIPYLKINKIKMKNICVQIDR